MNITSNTPRPQPPRNQRGSRLSWLFFLLILARPLWGIARSLVGPQVTNQQLALLIGGVVLAGIVVTLITRGAGRASSRGDQSLPVPNQPARDFRPQVGRATSWNPPRTPKAYTMDPPRFEPVITPKLVRGGCVLATIITGGSALIWLG